MIRVAHYLNQFFAGIGGEEKADAPFEVRQGAVGPGRALAMAFGDQAEVVQTLVCGDNRFHEDPDAAIEAAIAALEGSRPDLLVAGPAFNAGRYGLACGAVCAAARERLGIPSITGLFPEAPAVDVFRSRTVMVPTGDSAGSMKDAVDRIAAVGLRIADGLALRPAEVDGRIPMGYRANWVEAATAAERAIPMLLAKLSGQPFVSEVALPDQAEAVPPARLAVPLAEATVALVTEGGLVPEGNPDRIESSSATRWASYPVADLESGKVAFRSIHAGYDSRWVDEDPNRMVPVDAMRALVDEGVVGGLHDRFFATTGTGTSVVNASKIGDEIAKQLINEGVHAVIVTST